MRSRACSDERPSPTSATSGCSLAVTAATSRTSTSRAITSCPSPATTWASSSSRSRRSFAIRTRKRCVAVSTAEDCRPISSRDVFRTRHMGRRKAPPRATVGIHEHDREAWRRDVDADCKQPLSTAYKAINLAGISLPLLGLVLAIALLWDRMVGATEVSILAVGYVLTGVGVTVGFHRLFTHRSFQTSRAVRYAFAILGQMAVEGDVLTWVADHRKHHQYSDRAGDPHSPHADFGDGPIESMRGLWHAHTGWLFSHLGRANRERYAKDLMADAGLRLIADLFLPLMLLSLLLPALAGWLLIGGWYGFVAGLVWGGGVRILLLHHVTFSLNSICHMRGQIGRA